MLLLLNSFSSISQLCMEYNARTGKYFKDCFKVELLEILPFLRYHTSSFPGEVHTVRIILIFLYWNRTGCSLSVIISFLQINMLVFLFKWRDCKGRVVYIHSSWPLICSFMFISTKSIVKLSPLWDKDTAQEMSNCISWNFISEVPPLLSCSFTHHKSFTTCFL